jgi:hypothetical protein
MWGSGGRGMREQYREGTAARRGQGPQPEVPDVEPRGDPHARADVLEALPGDEGDEGDTPDLDGPQGEATNAWWRRAEARRLIREFLRSVPRSDTNATLAFMHPDGTPKVLTRGQLSAAVDRLRPRQRQILRLGVEERWPRPRVCEYLQHIAIKTYERDQVEGLDILMDL